MGEGWGEGEIRTLPLTPTPLRPRKSPLYHQPCQVKTRQSISTTPQPEVSGRRPSVSKNRKSAQVRPQARIASTPRSDPSQRTPQRCVLRPGPHRPGLSERNQGLNQLCVPTGRMLTTTRNLWRNPPTHHPPPDHPQHHVKPTARPKEPPPVIARSAATWQSR